MFVPRAEFWRIWGRFAAVCVLLIAAFVALPAKAEGWHRDHHGHHTAARHHARHRHHGAARDVRREPLISFVRGGDAVGIAMRYLGAGNPTGTHRAWCGDFVNMTERLAGRRGLASGGLASAWRTYGRASGPVRGAIAVMRGHVSRVVARLGDSVELISGNWSKRVAIHLARTRDIVAFRMP